MKVPRQEWHNFGNGKQDARKVLNSLACKLAYLALRAVK